MKNIFRRKGELTYRICNNILLKLLSKLYALSNIDAHYCVSKDGVFSTIDGMKFEYSFKHMSCMGNMDWFPELETESRDFLGTLIDDGQVIFDIGAHGGLYTIWLKKTYPNLTIYSFEPLADELKKNLTLNDLSLDDIHEVGLGQVETEASITVSERSSNHLTNNSDDNSKIIKIVTLDKYISTQKLKAPDFIKIDIEGMEYFALKGAAELLKSSSPIIMAEINGLFSRYFDSLGEFMSFMSSLSYEIYTLQRGKLHLSDINSIKELSDLPSSAENNYWFVPEAKKQMLTDN